GDSDRRGRGLVAGKVLGHRLARLGLDLLRRRQVRDDVPEVRDHGPEPGLRIHNGRINGQREQELPVLQRLERLRPTGRVRQRPGSLGATLLARTEQRPKASAKSSTMRAAGPFHDHSCLPSSTFTDAATRPEPAPSPAAGIRAVLRVRRSSARALGSSTLPGTASRDRPRRAHRPCPDNLTEPRDFLNWGSRARVRRRLGKRGPGDPPDSRRALAGAAGRIRYAGRSAGVASGPPPPSKMPRIPGAATGFAWISGNSRGSPTPGSVWPLLRLPRPWPGR